MKLKHIACKIENILFMGLVHEVKSNKKEHFLVTIGRHQQKQYQLNDSNKSLNCSLSFGQAALTFCLSGATSCSSYLMI